MRENKTRKLPLEWSDEALQDIKNSFSNVNNQIHKQIMGYIPLDRNYYKDTDFDHRLINRRNHSVLVEPWGNFTIRTCHAPKNKNILVFFAWITNAPIKYKHIKPSYVCEAGDRDNIIKKMVNLIKEDV